MVKDSINDWLKDRFNTALQQRSELDIDKRLTAVEEIWNDAKNVTSNCGRDENINHLKKKIWTLYSILTAQIEREGEEAISLKAVEPTVKDLSDEIADEMLDDLVTFIQEDSVAGGASIESFIETVNILFNRNRDLLMRATNNQVDSLQKALRLTMFNGETGLELNRAILDFCMYPNAFILAAYKVKNKVEKFEKGRIRTYNNTDYSFHRLNPWSVFPIDNTPTCKEWFVIEEYCAHDLKAMMSNPSAKEVNIKHVIKEAKKYSHKWYRANYKQYPDIKSKGIPVCKYFGMVSPRHSDLNEPAYGEIWMVGDQVIYESIGKDDTAVVLSASFRHNNDSVWGTGMVDIGWRLQRTIDKLSEMQVANIGYRSKPGGILPKSLAKHFVEPNHNGEGGSTKISYDRFYTVPDDVYLRNLGVRHFDVPDRSHQIQAVIDSKKAELDSLLGIPAFVDGSSNVGTLGRTSGGLFLVQKNMMQGIDSLWGHFAKNILVKLAQRIINGRFLEDSIELPLDFQVIVKDFSYMEEELEDADSIIKKVQALLSLSQSGLIAPQSAQGLADNAARKLGGNKVDLPEPQQQPAMEEQIPQEQASEVIFG